MLQLMHISIASISVSTEIFSFFACWEKRVGNLDDLLTRSVSLPQELCMVLWNAQILRDLRVRDRG